MPKRVYITGVTPSAARSPKRRTDYCDLPEVLFKSLGDAGYEVKWGAPLGALEFKPDFVFAGFIDPRSMVANEIYDLAYVLLKLYDFDPAGWCLYLPDWRIHQFLRGVSYCYRRPSYVEHPTHPMRERRRMASPDGHFPMQLLLEKWWNNYWPVVTASAFDWGEDDVMMKNEHGIRFSKLHRVDATSYFPHIVADSITAERYRAWSYAVLWNYDAWMEKQAFSWRVDHLGATPYTRLPEKKLLEEMQTRWGILSPPYDFKGAGLSRPRYKYAADLGSVLYTQKGELPSPSYNTPLDEIESMSTLQLQMLAHQQAADLKQWQLTQHEVQRRYSAIVEGQVTT